MQHWPYLNVIILKHSCPPSFPGIHMLHLKYRSWKFCTHLFEAGPVDIIKESTKTRRHLDSAHYLMTLLAVRARGLKNDGEPGWSKLYLKFISFKFSVSVFQTYSAWIKLVNGILVSKVFNVSELVMICHGYKAYKIIYLRYCVIKSFFWIFARLRRA